MKIAVVHDWLITYAGAEKCLEQILLLYPQADLFSLMDFLPPGERGFILDKKVRTSFLQLLPFARKKYRLLLPLMPTAIERFDMSGYDLVISSSHAVAKGVRTGEGQLHVCFCYTPIRYAWDMSDQYLQSARLDKGIKGVLARRMLGYIKEWDLRTVKGVDYFIAISNYIAERIGRIYGRESRVIYPPVDVDVFELCGKKENFYLTASRMVPYKKIDLIADAFSKTPERRLVVIGDGPEFKKIKDRARGNVELLGHQPESIVKLYMQRAKAFVFAAEEDFGIAPVEAQACGTPVIAFGKGGATETVIDGVTGIFFSEQTVESLTEAVDRFESIEGGFDPAKARKQAESFGNARFRDEFRRFIEGCVIRHQRLSADGLKDGPVIVY